MIELTIKVTDEDLSFSEKHLIYDPILLSLDDPTLKKLVDSLLEKFKYQDELKRPDIIVKAKMTL